MKLGGDPDWMAVGNDAVWISVARQKAVDRPDVSANKVAAKIEFPGKPGSGLVLGSGSLWVPIDGEKETPATLARVDGATNRIIAFLSAGPADSEGGITTSGDRVWLVTNKNGTLSRIDPAANTVRQKNLRAGGIIQSAPRGWDRVGHGQRVECSDGGRCEVG